MPCILPDGNVTETAKKVLWAAKEKTVEEIAKEAGLPLFRIRGSIRELSKAGFVEQKGDKYLTTEEGKTKL